MLTTREKLSLRLEGYLRTRPDTQSMVVLHQSCWSRPPIPLVPIVADYQLHVFTPSVVGNARTPALSSGVKPDENKGIVRELFAGSS